MSLYFSYMANRIPEHLRATRAVMNLSGHAATWFRCTGVNPGTITWEQLSYKLCQAFRPANFDQRAHVRLEQCTQMTSVAAYTTAFRYRLLECNDVSDQEAIQRHISGLKPDPCNWVRMHMGG